MKNRFLNLLDAVIEFNLSQGKRGRQVIKVGPYFYSGFLNEIHTSPAYQPYLENNYKEKEKALIEIYGSWSDESKNLIDKDISFYRNCLIVCEYRPGNQLGIDTF